MMPEHTATVEVLTAEVRVLMVGSRQVTMSVYNQLDEVYCGEIETFGRVSPPRASDDFIYVVGRSNDLGDLVRSYLPRPEYLESLRDHGTIKPSGGIVYFEWRRKLQITALYSTAEQCACEWAQLPLIVLAGLR
jgi:hypothetical protein